MMFDFTVTMLAQVQLVIFVVSYGRISILYFFALVVTHLFPHHVVLAKSSF